jgi:hypothetical protein
MICWVQSLCVYYISFILLCMLYDWLGIYVLHKYVLQQYK